MKTYIGCKVIQAVPMTQNAFLRTKGETFPDGVKEDAGYLVIYPDGYRSWSPLHVFEGAYREVTSSERLLITG